MSDAPILRAGWVQKLARDALLQDFRKRFLVLTDNALHYFHDEPSEDLMFKKNADVPISRASFELNRIIDAQIIGEKQRKIKLIIEEPTIKGIHSSHVPLEYIFRLHDNAEAVLWRDDIIRVRDALLEAREQAAHSHAPPDFRG